MLAALATLLALTATACGAGSTAPTGAPTPPSAASILQRAGAALGHVRSFHLAGAERGADGTVSGFSAEVSIPGRMAVSMNQNGNSVAMRLIGDQVYLLANAQYWVAAGVPASALPVLAGRWVDEPTATVPGIAGLRALTRPATLRRCAFGSQNDAISLGHPATIDGAPADVVIAHGQVPGSAPGRVYVAAGSVPLPLRIIQTGPSRPGGGDDPICGTTSMADTAVWSQYGFDRYDLPVHIAAPAHPLSLAGLRVAVQARTPVPLATSAASRVRESAQAAELSGTWAATGLVRSGNLLNEYPGASLVRRWAFRSGCAKGHCQLYFARSTVAKPIVAPLHWVNGHWTADFAEDDPCLSGGSDVQISHWVIAVSPTAISAVERSHMTTSTCGAGSSVVRWSARRIGRWAGAPAHV